MKLRLEESASKKPRLSILIMSLVVGNIISKPAMFLCGCVLLFLEMWICRRMPRWEIDTFWKLSFAQLKNQAIIIFLKLLNQCKVLTY